MSFTNLPAEIRQNIFERTGLFSLKTTALVARDCDRLTKDQSFIANTIILEASEDPNFDLTQAFYVISEQWYTQKRENILLKLVKSDLPIDVGGPDGINVVRLLSNRYVAVVEELLKRSSGFDINAAYTWCEDNEYEDTLLSLASYVGAMSVIETILDPGRPWSDTMDVNLYEPLKRAISCGRDEVLDKLLHHPNTLEVYKMEALEYALEVGSERCFHLIVDDMARDQDIVHLSLCIRTTQTMTMLLEKLGHIAFSKLSDDKMMKLSLATELLMNYCMCTCEEFTSRDEALEQLRGLSNKFVDLVGEGIVVCPSWPYKIARILCSDSLSGTRPIDRITDTALDSDVDVEGSYFAVMAFIQLSEGMAFPSKMLVDLPDFVLRVYLDQGYYREILLHQGEIIKYISKAIKRSARDDRSTRNKIEMLLNVPGLDVNLRIPGTWGKTLLHIACQNNDDGVVKMLLKREDIDVMVADHGGSRQLRLWPAQKTQTSG